jgi:NADH-quinone oxidoreductase subunit J
MIMEAVAFYALGSIAVIGALLMVTRRNPLGGAFSLILSLCALAGVFAMLHAEFIFILQILLYAGAITVLVIFTIMLLNLRKEELEEPPAGKIKTLFILVASAFGCYGFISVLSTMSLKHPRLSDSFGSVEEVGTLMMTSYLYPFEVVSVVLLVAIVGVVLLAKKVI